MSRSPAEIAAAKGVLEAIERARHVSPETLSSTRPRVWSCHACGSRLDADDTCHACGYNASARRRAAREHLEGFAVAELGMLCHCEICEHAAQAVAGALLSLFPAEKKK